jgi:hypothetical protein
MAGLPELPDFLGIDEQGDKVWELPDGRWTWGETAEEAMERARTFEPYEYVEKYGEPDPTRGLLPRVRRRNGRTS